MLYQMRFISFGCKTLQCECTLVGLGGTGFKVSRSVTSRGRRVREPPPENGSICAGADYDAVVGADLDAGDAAAMSGPHVGHCTVHIVPHLHQLVVSTWHEKVGK